MRRRDFITVLGGAAVWPHAGRAQQRERVRLIGILLPTTADNLEFQARVGAFLQGLQQSGWSIGRNVQIDTRWATANADEIRRHAAELAALAPDAIVAHGASSVGATLQATRTVPVVFPTVGDPVAAGAIHIYGGDFFAAERSEWDSLTLLEHRFDGERARRVFEEANARYEASKHVRAASG